MPSEVLRSKGFPVTTPVASDAVGFRFAGNAVPVNWFTVLLSEVRLQLEEAGVCRGYSTKGESVRDMAGTATAHS